MSAIGPKVILALVALCALAACSHPSPPRSEPSADAKHAVYVVRREHHSGIAIAAADWPDNQWPLLAQFPEAQYLEFGWGDAAYYQAREPTLGMTIASVFWPTPSVVEVLGLPDLPLQDTDDYEVVPLRLSEDQFRALTVSIAASFAGDAITPTGTHWFTSVGESRFYHARGKFHLFRMCNRWTADRLEVLGCSLRPWPVITATRALNEARRCQSPKD